MSALDTPAKPQTPEEEGLPYSPARVWVIATNTITEVIRQKVLYVFVLFTIILICSSLFFTEFSFNAQLKSIIDTCLGAIKILTALVAIVGTALLLPSEIENRTIYTILTKPVYRLEFLLGKVLGMCVLLFFLTVVMSMLFGGVLLYKEGGLVSEAMQGGGGVQAEDVQRAVQSIHEQTRNPNLIKAIILLYAQSVLLVSMTMMVSTFATSGMFTTIIMGLVYVCTVLAPYANQVWKAQPSTLGKLGLMFIGFFIPDLPSMTLVDDIVVGKVISTAYLWNTLGYAALYTLVVFGLGALIFQEKEL